MTQLGHKASLRHEAWPVFRIISEFADAFETLAKVGSAVNMFGSARTRPIDPDYHRADARRRFPTCAQRRGCVAQLRAAGAAWIATEGRAPRSQHHVQVERVNASVGDAVRPGDIRGSV